jgi:hypothetical protein
MTGLTQIIGFVAGFWDDFCGAARPDCHAEKAVLPWHESQDGRDLRHVPDRLGDLRPLNRLKECRYVECDRDSDQLSHRWGIHVLSSPRRATLITLIGAQDFLT